MANDIRLSVDFLTHRKRKKLQKELGEKGVLALIDLWLSTAVQRPSGSLNGYDEIDIELDANWAGEDGVFVKTLISLGLLDLNEGVFYLHNWKDRQGWVVETEARGDKARFSRFAKVNPEKYKELHILGVRAISRKDYKKYNESMTNVNESSSESMTNVNGSLTPAPAPAPSPSPKENKSLPQKKDFAVDIAVEFYITKKKRKLSGKRLLSFNRFWGCFNYKKDKASAADSWLDIPCLTDSLVDTICSSATKESEQRTKILTEGRTPIYAQGWLAARRWEDEIEPINGEKLTKEQTLEKYGVC